MKNAAKSKKSRVNGAGLTRKELLAAHEDSIRLTDKMTAREVFQIMVRAGIYTPGGKLTRRYGGRAKNQPAVL